MSRYALLLSPSANRVYARAAATLTVAGDLTPAAESTLTLELVGPAPTTAWDQLAVTGAADVRALDLDLEYVGGFGPTIGPRLGAVTAGTLTGPLAHVDAHGGDVLRTRYTDTALTLTANVCRPDLHAGVDLSTAGEAMFAALAELVGTYGEDAVAKFVEGLPARVRNAEFSIGLAKQ